MGLLVRVRVISAMAIPSLYYWLVRDGCVSSLYRVKPQSLLRSRSCVIACRRALQDGGLIVHGQIGHAEVRSAGGKSWGQSVDGLCKAIALRRGYVGRRNAASSSSSAARRSESC